MRIFCLLIMNLGLLSSCCTVMNGSRQDIVVKHERATWAKVYNSSGVLIAHQEMPYLIRVKTSAGLLKKEHYTIKYIFEGGDIETKTMKTVVNPWLFGNLIYGEIPGAVIDIATGALFRIKQ